MDDDRAEAGDDAGEGPGAADANGGGAATAAAAGAQTGQGGQGEQGFSARHTGGKVFKMFKV